MGTTAAFVIATQRGIGDMTEGDLDRFSNKFIRASATHANVSFQQSGPKNAQQYTVTAEFNGYVDYDAVENLLGKIHHPYVVSNLWVSHPAPRGIHDH